MRFLWMKKDISNHRLKDEMSCSDWSIVISTLLTDRFSYTISGKTTSSRIKIAGKSRSVQVVSPNAKRRMTNSSVARVSPIGQIRQNTGNPKIAADRREPPRTAWRESGFHFLFPFSGLTEHVVHVVVVASSEAAESTVSSAFFTISAASILRSLAFTDRPGNQCWIRGVGQIQAQNIRPNTTIIIKARTREMTARGNDQLGS